MSDPLERRLAAIMFTDIVGYTALMAGDESSGHRVRARQGQVLRPLVEQYGGEWVQHVGDETLSSFPSAVDAANCALAIQAALHDESELRVRIGIHVGDVVVSEGSVHGDGVNIASRIRPLAEPGGICVSDEVQHAIRSQPNIEAVPLGEHELKNVGRPVAVFALSGTAAAPRPPARFSALRAARSRIRVGSVASAVLLLAVAGWWLNRPGVDVSSVRSIAVLPLESLSDDPEQGYFAAGMTEALIGDLARISSLRVISRTSVMRYRDTDKSIKEIAGELDVDSVLEGTVAREGNRVRITVQLIDARSDHHLWAQSYERDLRGVLALQTQVAREVAGQIRLELTPEDEARLGTDPPVDPRAHEEYLRGRVLYWRNTPADMLTAIEHFEEAVRIDPDYALGYAGLADAYS